VAENAAVKAPKKHKDNTDFGAGSKLFYQEHLGSHIFNRLQYSF
jgi:hypothetical protein